MVVASMPLLRLLWNATALVRPETPDEAGHIGVRRVALPVDLGDLVANCRIVIVGQVLRDHVAHEGQAGAIDLQMERGVYVRLISFDVPQDIEGADGELSSEVATHAKRFDHVELSAKPAHQFERGINLILGSGWPQSETDLVINHSVPPCLRRRHHRLSGSVAIHRVTLLNRQLTFFSPTGHLLVSTWHS